MIILHGMAKILQFSTFYFYVQNIPIQTAEIEFWNVEPGDDIIEKAHHPVHDQNFFEENICQAFTNYSMTAKWVPLQERNRFLLWLFSGSAM